MMNRLSSFSDNQKSLILSLNLSSFFFVFFFFTYCFFYEFYDWFSYEETSVVELSTFLMYLFSGIVLLYFSFQQIRGGKKWTKFFFYILLGLVFLFVAGEEISWGQSFLRFATPKIVERINEQDEINIHNLIFFYKKFLWFDFWADAFVFGLGVFLPLVYLFSKRIRNILTRFNFPILPKSCIPFFLTGFFYSYGLSLTKIIAYTELLEQKEFFIGLGFTFYGLHILSRVNNETGRYSDTQTDEIRK